jgi:hypothetical protein
MPLDRTQVAACSGCRCCNRCKNLPDEQIEYQAWDQVTVCQSWSEDGIPDGTTLSLFREKLARAGLIDTLLDPSRLDLALLVHRQQRHEELDLLGPNRFGRITAPP